MFGQVDSFTFENTVNGNKEKQYKESMMTGDRLLSMFLSSYRRCHITSLSVVENK